MAFVLPTFNLQCNIYTGAQFADAPRLTVACNLAWGKRVNGALAQEFSGHPSSFAVMTLLLPSLTDIRDTFNSSGSDGVECPAGSGRWYFVDQVDDLGKGFPNEHRGAILEKAGSWPTPVP